MPRLAYLLLAAVVFIAAIALHALSYRVGIPAWTLLTMTASTLALCIPLGVLFLRIKKEGNAVNLWPRFWQAALERCPRWICGSVTVAVLLMWATGVATLFFGLRRVPFQTAALLIPASAALSYVVTLWRSDENRT